MNLSAAAFLIAPMNNTYLRLSCMLICACVVLTGHAREKEEEKPIRMVVSSTTLGVGSSDLLDTYLTPADYRGYNLNLRNERLQVAARGTARRINQQYVWGSYTSNHNRPGNGTMLSGFAGYSWGTLWEFSPEPDLKLMVGPYASGECGFVYNTRNGNNPATGKLSLNAGVSVMAAYTFPFERFSFTLRYQVSMPVAGMFFSPQYEQSYYEIFELGNTKGIVHFASFHNQFDLDNYLTADLPIGNLYLRLGFLSTIRNTHVNDIKNRRISNSFMIGFVKQFYPFSKKRKHTGLTNTDNPVYPNRRL